jgi:Tubulin domain
VLPCVALRCLALPCVALPCVALRCLALPCVALRCLALPCVALRCLALSLCLPLFLPSPALADPDNQDYIPEIDPRITLRVTEDRDQQLAYTPRAVIIDALGATGSVSVLGSQHPDVHSSGARPELPGTWTGAVSYCPSDRVQPSSFRAGLSTGSDEQALSRAADRYKGSSFADLEAELEDSGSASGSTARYANNSSAHSQHDAKLTNDQHNPNSSNTRPAVFAADVPGLLDKFDASTVRYWTDYMKLDVAQESLCMLEGIHHGITPFEYFSHGEDYMSRPANVDRFLDSIRFFAEECDSLQGFQFFAEMDSGFTGVASRLLTEVRDDYGAGKAIITFGCEPHKEWSTLPHSKVPLYRARRHINNSLGMHTMSDMSNLYVPLSAQNWNASTFGNRINVRSSNVFETSAVLATAIHTATMPYRKLREFTTMHGMATAMTPWRRLNVCSMVSSMPIHEELSRVLDVIGTASFSEEDTKDVEAYAKSIGSATSLHIKQRSRVAQLAMNSDQKQKQFEPLYRASFVTNLSGLSASTDTIDFMDTNETMYAEWSVLRGSRKCFTPKLLRSHGKNPKRCWQPFVSYMQATPANSRFATYIDDAMPVPIPYPDYFQLPAREHGRMIADGVAAQSATPDNKLDVLLAQRKTIRDHANAEHYHGVTYTEIPIMTDMYSSPQLRGLFTQMFSDLETSLKNQSVVHQFDKAHSDAWDDVKNYLQELEQEYDNNS